MWWDNDLYRSRSMRGEIEPQPATGRAAVRERCSARAAAACVALRTLQGMLLDISPLSRP
jgi:hypothetical protein